MDLRIGLGLLTVCVLAACGSGGPGADGELTAAPLALFSIRTETLPAGSVGSPYPPTPLTLDAEAPERAAWSLHAGHLPDGLDLLPEGRLVGTPSLAGLWVFTVRAQTGGHVALKRLAVAVDTLGLFAQEGVFADRAWTGAPVRLRVAGAVGTVAFQAAGESGGAVLRDDPVRGTATYVPGPSQGNDTIEVIDDAGRIASLTLPVITNPLAHRTAHFGASDVWYLDVYCKTGAHAYATDFHDALAALGLRGANSHTITGTEADELAATWVRLQVHRLLNTLYGRDASGAQGENGLAISFSWDHPAAPHTTPVAGGRAAGAPHRFSVMALTHSDGVPLAGRALVDDPTNSRHEHNAPGADGHRLGVFVDAIANSTRYLVVPTPLHETPVHGADVPTLRALLNGEPLPAGDRARAIRDVGAALAQALAKVAAHEIAHSLGLGHSEPAQPGSLMNPTIDIHPIATLRFTDSDEQALRAVLPGPQRATAAALLAVLSGQGGSVCACGLRSER